MSRQQLVSISPTNNEPAPFPAVTKAHSPPPGGVCGGDLKLPINYQPSYIKTTEPPGSGSGINSSSYSPPYISSGAASPRDNVSVSFQGSNAYGDHTTDYSTHSSNSQGRSNVNSPWARFNAAKQAASEPNITVNPNNRMQSSQFSLRSPGVITQQPKATSVTMATGDTQQDWSTGLCQCCDGTNTCFAICCCLPCFECWLSNRMEEGCCMPLCVPLSVMALRLKMRYQHNIKGSILGDFCASVWCCPCVLCQIKRELDYRETKSTISRHSNFV